MHPDHFPWRPVVPVITLVRERNKTMHSAGNETAPSPGDGQAAAALEKLAAALAARGYKAQLNAPGGRPPSLAVTNPEATVLTETVMADTTSFWWPWADRIAGVADVAAAADVIARVLAAVPGGAPA